MEPKKIVEIGATGCNQSKIKNLYMSSFLNYKRITIHYDSVLFTHFNTKQYLLTVANIGYAESGEVPSLESVVWRHGCISYDERIWKKFCCILTQCDQKQAQFAAH
jgi:hypothetical protein